MVVSFKNALFAQVTKEFGVNQIFYFLYVVGLPAHLGGVAHALGPWQWTNNSTDLLDMK